MQGLGFPFLPGLVPGKLASNAEAVPTVSYLAARQASVMTCWNPGLFTPGVRAAPRARPITGSIQGTTATFTLAGTSRDSAGVALAGCGVLVFDGANKMVGYTVSDGLGVYSLTVPTNGPYWIRFYKAGAPNLAGTTDKTLMAV